ncbi:hypothetical protein ABEW60_26050 [Paenibacillus jamilae]|uniref:hypothetical protein n=1 Tax=Paenibacillus jamilae TaxID=114136 RepID=UPI003D2E1A18
MDEILNKFFYKDGSLRDIYILDTTSMDWDKLLTNFKFTIYKNGEIMDDEYIPSEQELLNGNLINVNLIYKGISFNGYYNNSDFIEFDLHPTAIDSIESLNKLLDFMKELTQETNKEIILTPESTIEEVYISVKPNETIKYNL